MQPIRHGKHRLLARRERAGGRRLVEMLAQAGGPKPCAEPPGNDGRLISWCHGKGGYMAEVVKVADSTEGRSNLTELPRPHTDVPCPTARQGPAARTIEAHADAAPAAASGCPAAVKPGRRPIWMVSGAV